MQHVLRCWKRQSNGTEYKKTLRLPGLRPEPPFRKPHLVQRGWLPPPQEPHPPAALGPLGLACLTPTPKLVPTQLSMQASGPSPMPGSVMRKVQGLILSVYIVQPNCGVQNEKYGVQNSIFTSRNQLF